VLYVLWKRAAGLDFCFLAVWLAVGDQQLYVYREAFNGVNHRTRRIFQNFGFSYFLLSLASIF
jgi:hypothetical protein